MGHSCSTHILSSILLDSTQISPSLTPSSELLRAVKGAFFSEGLYDIDALIMSFPGYDRFIADVFGRRSSYAQFSVTTLLPRPGGNDIRWLIAHSSGDTIVNHGQSRGMYDHLRDIVGANVSGNWEDLTGDHNEVFSDQFLRLVGEFVAGKASGDL